MRRNIQNSVAVITGASSGIGRATAHEFARRGAKVVLAARDEQALQEAARECEQIGSQALVCATDVTKEEDVQKLVSRAVEHFGSVDTWVNNAAVTAFGRFEEMPSDDFRRVIDVNFFGYVNGARAVIPVFREQGQGVLINVSSVVGVTAQPYTSAYVTSKYAIRGLSDALSQEFADEPGIDVCTIYPGSTDTPLFQHGANYYGKAVKPVPPVGEPEAVADAIVNAAAFPREEVFVGAPGHVLAALKAAAPRTFDRFYRELIERNHFYEEPVAACRGNLFDPMPGLASIRGGWKSGLPMPKKPSRIRQASALTAGAVASVFLACVTRQRAAARRAVAFP